MFIKNIAHFIEDTRYEDLPIEVVDMAKRAFIDNLAVSLAGSQEIAAKKIREYVREVSSEGKAGIVAGNFKTHPTIAALANGVTAHVLDYDDTEWDCIAHLSAVIVPAVLAMGDYLECSGKEVLTAYVIGYEVAARIGMVCGKEQYDLNWHTTSTIGSFASCAAAASLLCLGKEKITTALGIAASFSSGLQCNFGSYTKSLHAGHAAQNGCQAALLADKGFTANEDVFENQIGFCTTFCGGKSFNYKDPLKLHPLSSSWRIVSPGIIFKPYPCCTSAHPSLDAVKFIQNKHRFSPDDIVEIECRTSKEVYENLPFHRPENELQAISSMEYCISRVILNGKLAVSDFFDGAVRDSAVQDIISKIKYLPSTELGFDLPQEVIIKLRDGKKLSHQVKMSDAKGQENSPFTLEELATKGRECALTVLPSHRVESFLQTVQGLDALPKIGELTNMLCFVE